MELKFLGAAECITGSCHLLVANGKKILLDCGLFQARDIEKHKNEEMNFNPREIDYVILSHCHVDHSGRIPLLYKRGYEGKVICTKPTIDLTKYLLLDTVKIQGEEIYHKNLSRQEEGLEPLTSLYDEEDVNEAISRFEGYDYNKEIILDESIKLIFRDAGHVLGSAICEILIKNEGNTWNKLVYSGDLGNKNKEILKNPQNGLECDYLILESTYGDKIHPRNEDNYGKLLNIIRSTMVKGGNVLIPCFSLGRTQEIIYMINEFVESGKLKNCRVYVDSPLAASITKVFKKYEKYYDEEAKRLISKGDNPLEFKGLYFVDDSIRDQVYQIKSGAVIIVAGSNFKGGRAAKHLQNNISRRECSIVVTSYKGRRSIMGKLIKGYSEVDLLGERMKVKSSIYYLGGLSGHADKIGLIDWVNKLQKKPEKIFLVHGEINSLNSFMRELCDNQYCVNIARNNEKTVLK